VKRRPPAIQPRPQFDERLRYPIPQAALLLSQSEQTTWTRIREGRIQVIKDGHRTYIPGSEILRLSSLPTSAAA
jgi:hypothetical protein